MLTNAAPAPSPQRIPLAPPAPSVYNTPASIPLAPLATAIEHHHEPPIARATLFEAQQDQHEPDTEERPGGWNIVGRTPLELVNVRDEYFPLRTGDRVQFERIDEGTFQRLGGKRLAPTP